MIPCSVALRFLGFLINEVGSWWTEIVFGLFGQTTETSKIISMGFKVLKSSWRYISSLWGYKMKAFVSEFSWFKFLLLIQCQSYPQWAALLSTIKSHYGGNFNRARNTCGSVACLQRMKGKTICWLYLIGGTSTRIDKSIKIKLIDFLIISLLVIEW